MPFAGLCITLGGQAAAWLTAKLVYTATFVYQ